MFQQVFSMSRFKLPAWIGSPLELRFLRLFEEHGFTPAKQVPVSPIESGSPISIADFAVPESRLAIYIDGAAFHVGSSLRRDAFIRSKLRQGASAWTVEELRAADMAQGARLVERLKVLAGRRQDVSIASGSGG
jgi:hypothetical protein